MGFAAPKHEIIPNVQDIKHSLQQAIANEDAGDLVWLWIQTLPEELHESHIDYYREFWKQGIVITMKPQGRRYRLRELRDRHPWSAIDEIKASEYMDRLYKSQCIEAHQEFCKWLKVHTMEWFPYYTMKEIAALKKGAIRRGV